MGNKFAIPYNGLMDPVDYYNRLLPYVGSVESVYFSMPSMLQSQQDLNYKYISADSGVLPDRIKESVDGNCRELMRLLKPLPVKAVLALNGFVYDMNPFSRKVFIETLLLPLAEDGLINGVIVSDFGLALDLRSYIPQIELQISCNSFSMVPRNMDLWHEKTGATYFNPPRETIRNFGMLKDFRETGYTMKVIVNDYCLYGCPQHVAHPVFQCFLDPDDGFPMVCSFVKHYNIFRMNFVLPHNLHLVEEYIDVFKIVGRQDPTPDGVFYRLDAYVNRRKDVDLLKLLPGRLSTHLKMKYPGLQIPTGDLPDKFVRCECKCGKHCKDGNLCKETFVRILESQGMEYKENPFLARE